MPYDAAVKSLGHLSLFSFSMPRLSTGGLKEIVCANVALV